MKDLIDASIAEKVSELKALETKITIQLDSFKSECDSVTKRLEDLMKESKEATKSDNDVLIVDVEEHMSTLTMAEPTFECVNATFAKGSINIKEALGAIVYEELPNIEAPTSNLLTKQIISNLLDLSDRGLPNSILRTRQGTLWLNANSNELIRSIDISGSQKKLKLDVHACFLCCCIDQLYCITTVDESIRAVDTTTGKTTKLFDCDARTCCINITKNGSAFITGTRDNPEVKMYNRSGKVLQTVQTVDTSRNIAVCRSTGRVAIACEEGVMVMDNRADRLHHMYTYPTTEASICAYDAAFDDEGRLLVPDYLNDKIYIVDAATGQTLIAINMDYPLLLTVKKKGYLAVVTSAEKKKIFGKKQNDRQGVNR